jgi:hypothetical protein
MRKVFLRWWIIFCLASFGALGIFFLGFFGYLWEVDLSKISFLILGLFAGTSAWIGYLTSKLHRGNIPFYSLKVPEAAADWMLALGLIGTLFGFSWVLINSFTGIDISQTDQIKSAMGEIGAGMGTAVYTSLVGMTCSLLTKVQLLNLENGYDRKSSGE